MEFKAVTYGKYFLLERLAVGGMAEVFKAKTFGVHGFERLLVIKRILPHLCEDEEFVEMFIDEAKISVELSHPNIAQIFDLGKIGDNYFIAMEYIDGKDLRAILKKLKGTGRKISIPMAVFIAMEVCKGLDYAHNKKDANGKPLGIIHRDISPQNIMISYEGAVKIVDFGIAKAESKLSKTQAGVLKGKFGYMSPEQALGGNIDHRTDIFSLGIVLFEILTGRRLFLGDSDFETLEMIKKAEVPPPSKFREEIPEVVDKIVLKALEKEPDMRFASAKDMQVELTKFFYQTYSEFTYSDIASFMKDLFKEEIKEEKKRISAITSSISMKDVLKAELHASRSDRVINTASQNIKSIASAPKGKISPPEEESLRKSLLKSSTVEPTQHYRSLDTKGIKINDILGGKVPQKNLIVFKKAVIPTVVLLVIIAVFIWFAKSEKIKSPLTPPTGTFIITSIPDKAEVFIDDELKGLTPLSIKVPADKSYKITVKRRGFKPWSAVLSPPAGAVQKVDTGKLEPEIKTARLRIDTDPPGAIIYLNDKNTGKATPAVLDNLEIGKEFTLVIKKEGYEKLVKRFKFESEGEKSRIFKLVRIPKKQKISKFVTVLITSDPQGAIVKINGRRRGKTPITLDKFVRGKKYKIEVTKEGYKTVAKNIKFTRDYNRQSFKLKPSYGTISINAIPWAHVTIDGKNIGDTPIINRRIPAGTHILEFEHPDYGISRQKFTLKENEVRVFKKKWGSP